jgi:hypothetical protein
MKVDTSVFNTSQQKFETKLFTNNSNASFFDEEDNPRSSEDNDKTYAKAVKNKPSKHFSNGEKFSFSFYIKTNPSKVIYDPNSINDTKIHSFINKVCKSEWSYREVSESVFNKYINFLKTENVQWLNNAQRELK